MTLARSRATYSARLLQAFVDALREHGEVGNISARFVEEQAGERVAVEVAHRALAAAVEVTGDPDLGLKAARRLTLGDAGAIDYLVSSAPTLGEAIEAAARYTRLINDVLDVRLEFEGTHAIVRLENTMILPRAALDFQVGGFFRNHVCEWRPDRLAEFTVQFTHSEPADVGEYERTFAPAAVSFGAACVGFRFDRRFLDEPISRADPKLHGVLRPYVEHSYSALELAKSVTSEVADAIRAQLSQGQPGLTRLAPQLGMSVRTLARRLESEGTTFRDVLDDVRRKLAIDYIRKSELGISEIAEQLGFAHVAALHRAFRRWTDQSPLQYRKRAARGDDSARIDELAQRSRRRRRG